MTQVLNETTSQSTPPVVTGPASARNSRAGLIYGLSAYVIWGFIPIYFHALSNVPPLVVLFHRIIWSALFLGVVVSVRQEWKSILPVLTSRKNLVMLSAGAVLIAL